MAWLLERHRPTQPPGTLAYWRERILGALIIGLAALGLVAYVPSLWLSLSVDRLDIAVVDTVVYAWLLWLLMASTGFRARAFQVVALVYGLAVFLLVALGPLGAGLLWLFGAALIATVLFGTRAAVAALAIDVPILSALGFAVFRGGAWDTHVRELAPLTIVLSVNLWLLQAAVTLSIGVLLHGLETSVERERIAQRALERARRLEAIGSLAGGIAHELNNILTPVVTLTTLVRDDLGAGDPARQDLDEVLRSCDRARELVRRVLRFGRGRAGERVPLSLREILGESLTLLRHSLPAPIALRDHFAAERDVVLGDPAELQEIVLALASNSEWAMREKGGTLAIELTEVAPADLPDELARGPRYLRLVVADTGAGMTPEVVERAFEPFFTTKPVSEGSGLGLATIESIVRRMGGSLSLDSRVGVGTTVQMFLPCTDEPVPRNRPISGPILQVSHARVLVVDDEQGVRAGVARLLERWGLHVELAESADQALALLDAGSAFDLVLTDMTMEGMSGVDMAAEIRRRAPRLPVVLMTGYAEDGTRERARAAGIDEVVFKPVDADGLKSALSRALASVGAAGP